MPEILVASDAAWLQDELRSVLAGGDTTVHTVQYGSQVLPAAAEHEPDLAILDLQIGNMGGMAACMELRLEEGAGRLGHVPVLVLLDRRPDVFLARRCGADGWLVKPLEPIRLRRAVRALLAGERWEDPAYLPSPVLAGSDTIADDGK